MSAPRWEAGIWEQCADDDTGFVAWSSHGSDDLARKAAIGYARHGRSPRARTCALRSRTTLPRRPSRRGSPARTTCRTERLAQIDAELAMLSQSGDRHATTSI